jgi:Type II secretion system (T2SS), protein E, N-terminal domain
MVGIGTSAPGERLFRMEAPGACAGCGEMTEWSDLSLNQWVCSDECRERLATQSSAPPLVGQLLVSERLITEAQLDEALRLQAGLDTYTPIGQVLVDQSFITLKELDTVLDKYRKRPKLGAVLLAAGVITVEQLGQAMARHRSGSRRLGDALLELGFATEHQIKQAVCVQLNLPFIDLDHFTPEPGSDLARTVEQDYAAKHRVVPIARLGNSLTVAMDDPTDADVIRTVETSTGLAVNVVMATRSGLRHALAAVYH